ncbi:hypothetical protein MIND_00405000 [Mycena indigotica]|uniref:Uncharacterized protein n=1 Tax=Mycena indigotica TaxID=2126181 RepID=A0A8H6T3N5_9AGAR|nr:uncharacterized protein MIND_00405000 [Mycena indigotica]KAF7310309.1 hypothetical protein MIND_00405000 [Mycena indigotica]
MSSAASAFLAASGHPQFIINWVSFWMDPRTEAFFERYHFDIVLVQAASLAITAVLSLYLVYSFPTPWRTYFIFFPQLLGYTLAVNRAVAGQTAMRVDPLWEVQRSLWIFCQMLTSIHQCLFSTPGTSISLCLWRLRQSATITVGGLLVQALCVLALRRIVPELWIRRAAAFRQRRLVEAARFSSGIRRA